MTLEIFRTFVTLKKYVMRKLYTTLSFAILLALASANAQIYVNELAPIASLENGSSWDDAFRDIESALAIANDGDEIWVSSGEYFPPVVTIEGVETNAYVIDENIKLYGAFSGTETSIEQRNFDFNPTLLNGDILGDDTGIDLLLNKDDNASHVIYITEDVDDTALIDGFFIFRGAAIIDESNTSTVGGGIYSAGKANFANLSIQQCVAEDGGGVYIIGNNTGDITFTDCNIDNNRATELGGGLLISNVNSIRVRNSKVSRITTDEEGAICIADMDQAVFDNVVIRENIGDFCSAMYSDNIRNLQIIDCDINTNMATNNGTIYVGESELLEITNTKIENNNADSISAGVLLDNSSASIVNSSISGNIVLNSIADTEGQLVIEGNENNNINFNHSTIAGVNAPSIYSEATITTSNTIFASQEMGTFAGSGTIVSQGGNLCSDLSMSTGLNMTTDLTNVDPQFRDLSMANVKLASTSPAIGVAVSSSIVEDVDGNLRDANPDMGAYEFVLSATSQTDIPDVSVTLAPSMTRESFVIQWEGAFHQNIRFDIVDMNGKLISQNIKLTERNQDVNVSAFQAGQYQIVFRSNSGLTTRSFIKL